MKKIIFLLLIIICTWAIYSFYQCGNIPKDFFKGFFDGGDAHQSSCDIWKKYKDDYYHWKKTGIRNSTNY